MANVYELGTSFDVIDQLIEEEVMDDEALLDAWENLKEDTTTKFENCCKYIKNVEADIEGIDAEIKRLQAKKKSLTNGKDRLKALMLRVLTKMGEKKLPCGTFTVGRQNNAPSLLVKEGITFKDVGEEYLRFTDPEIDKRKAIEDLKAGKELTWCELNVTESLRIR